jgi:hypothetical protein
MKKKIITLGDSNHTKITIMTVFHHKKVLHISSISYMNLRTVYIDNCKLKKTRNRLMGYSVKINEIDKKKKSLFTTYILL